MRETPLKKTLLRNAKRLLTCRLRSSRQGLMRTHLSLRLRSVKLSRRLSSMLIILKSLPKLKHKRLS